MNTTMDKEKLKKAIAASSSWVEVAIKMGKAKGSGGLCKKAAEHFGLDYSNLIPSHMLEVNAKELEQVFVSKVSKDRLAQRRAAIGTAVEWFLSNGYYPSIPVETERYDLVVESPEGFKKVQIKSSENIKDGKYQVALRTTSYDSTNGKYVKRAYIENEIDYFFVVCADGSKYIIPFVAVSGKVMIAITQKYASFKVE